MGVEARRWVSSTVATQVAGSMVSGTIIEISEPGQAEILMKSSPVIRTAGRYASVIARREMVARFNHRHSNATSLDARRIWQRR